MSAKQKPAEFYVRGADEKVFGPVDVETLVEWAGDSRIDPTSSVSKDQKTWIAAPLVPELGMTWLVETAPGTFYGPFNRRVVDGLFESGTLTRDARLYELDTGKAAAERAKLEAELAAKTAAVADLEKRAAEQAETTKKTMAFMEAKLTELTAALGQMGKAAESDHATAREEVFSARERADAAEARAVRAEADRDAVEKKLSVVETELADLRAQLEAVTKFSSAAAPERDRSDAIQPEVVISDAPPPRAAPQFPGMGSASGLAALEAAARRELAAAKKHGISLGGMFGGKK
jgi:hypothetical protein